MTTKNIAITLLTLGLAVFIGLQVARSPSQPESASTDDTVKDPAAVENYEDLPGSPDEVKVKGTDRVEGFTYRRPKPGDSDYADYKAMLSHERFARFVNENSKPPYYDPEWRAEINGRREVAVNDLSLLGGALSQDELGEFLLMALADSDGDAIDQLRMTRDEYLYLCWPEFPQSRPYLRIPGEEAWMMHFASMRKGARKALNIYGGRNFNLVEVRVNEVMEYTNFRLHNGITLVVEAVDTGKREELGFVTSIIECRGKLKVFMFNDEFEYEDEYLKEDGDV